MEKKINLRKLNDTDCTSVVATRQMMKLIKQFPSLNKCHINRCVDGKLFTKFEKHENELVWLTDKGDVISSKDEDVDRDSLNKLIVHTFRTMCAQHNNNVDLSETPEDILAYAESKLQELLHDDKT